MRHVTINDVLYGHNFPEGGYWRASWKEYFESLFRIQSYSREEARDRCNGTLEITINAWNRMIERNEQYQDVNAIRQWLLDHPEETPEPRRPLYMVL